ncbi:class I SAM-dependent methyltransferase [Gammaproteobacteria bacterium]|jgi:2-polyprenyl-3-methyl-5-hydroxy-6-metoxy-1,4-benzoquinol methylase|nr:class I SAM-dependent methyltransferase [Gammaproteobacteria bacterium]
MTTKIFQTLEKLGLASEQTRVLFSNRTRDNENLKVWRDSSSGVIYIDDYYIGDEIYIDGAYRKSESVKLETGVSDFERNIDAQRRFKSNLKFVAGKRVADFGCGSGDFLKLVQPYCKEIVGVELQQNYIDELISLGIPSSNSIDAIKDSSLDIIVSFHVLEHLPNPLDTLLELIEKVASGGQILIEVPHAKDFLLSSVDCEAFKEFTLWSQHLVLHTRESLRRTLEYVGLEDIQIEGVQRYPLSNHLNWLANGKPGGHKSLISVLDSDTLFNAYQQSLSRIDATDTLVAIAKVP